MRILGTTISPGEPGQFIIMTTIEIGDDGAPERGDVDLGEGPTGEAIPDRIVQELISSAPSPLSLAELQQFVGANPATVARQAWTLATNAPDLQHRLRGWVVSPARGRYALSRAAQRRIGGRGTGRSSGQPLSPALREFADGVAFWTGRRNWPKDLHNADYRQLSDENPHGHFNIDWWQPFLKRLQAWIATRPISGSDLTERFTDARSSLEDAWRSSCAPFVDDDISTVTWEQVKAFPEAVASIKPTLTPSAVFTSKFCHFLLPRVFPVVDDEALGNAWPTYERYFRFVQEEWVKTDAPTRDELIAALTGQVEAGGDAIFDGFPVTNKIVELRLVGRKHPRPAEVP